MVSEMGSKQREALEKAKKLFDGRLMFQQAIREAHEAVNAAIAEPVRNCEVGTADEQIKRHKKWCATSKDFSCHVSMCRECYAKWSQMPYEI